MKGKVSVLRTDLEQMEMIDSRDTVGLRSPRNSYEIALPTRERRLPWYRRRLSLTTSVDRIDIFVHSRLRAGTDMALMNHK